MRSEKTKVAHGYIRVSTAGQASEGVSLEAQQARIEAWAVANGYSLASVHVDAGLSGGRADNRPGLQAALADVCRRRGVLVVYSLSRMARSTKDTLAIAERLDRAGADLVSLSESIDTTSAAGRMVFKMLAVLAEFERDLTAERTTAALRHLRAEGRRVSGREPYGWRFSADGRLEPLEDEQRGLERMRALRAEGLSLRAIGAALEAAGYLPKNAPSWRPNVVAACIRRAEEMEKAA